MSAPPDPTPHDRLLLRVSDVAALVGQPERTIYRWAAQGRLPGVKRLGRALFIARLELERWLGLDGQSPPSSPDSSHE